MSTENWRPAEADAIFWVRVPRVSTGSGPADYARTITTTSIVDGKVVRERKPQLSHRGGDYDKLEQHPLARARRYVDVVRHDGNIVALVLTNGAGTVEITEYSNAMKRKAKFFGWFPVDSCVVRCVEARVTHREHIVDKTLLEETPCDKGSVPAGGCEHTRREIEARRGMQSRTMAELDAVETSKQLAHERSIAAASAAGIASALAPMMAELVSAVTAPKGRKG